MGSIKRSLANNITTGGAFDATDLSGTIPSTNVADASLTNLTSFSPALGDTIESVASDPSPATEGQFWYNSTSGALKGLVQLKAWSAGSNMGTARYLLGGAGTQTAGLAFGGADVNGTALNPTEEYSGYTWSAGGNLGTTRKSLAGAGTQTAGLGFGGLVPPSYPTTTATEEYDGSAWTAGGNLNTARQVLGGAGIQTAGLAFGGRTTTQVANTEEYDGSVWTIGGSLGTGRQSLAGAGTQTAGLGFGGLTGPPNVYQSATEEYDGSAWTAGGNLNTGRQLLGGAGIQTSALAFTGNIAPGNITATEQYDGTSWNTVPSMTTARYGLGGEGTSSAALGFGGYITGVVANTEEFNSSINTPLSGVWASGGNLNTARSQGNVAGTQTAGLLFGGETPPGGDSAATEEYNGSTWASGNNMGTARFDLGTGSIGIQTSALGVGGFINPSGRSTATEEYDGTSWTTGGALPAGIYEHSVFGTQTAGVINNGSTAPAPGGVNTTLEYDGSAWASGGNTSLTTRARSGVGTISAGKTIGGRPGAATFVADVEDYDGTSWTAGTNFLRTIQGTGSGGTQNNVLMGNNPLSSPSLNAASYDGTAWTTESPLTTGRQRLAGNTQAAIAASGSGSEEWSGPQTTATASTITTS